MGFLKKFTNYESFVIKSKSKFEKNKAVFCQAVNQRNMGVYKCGVVGLDGRRRCPPCHSQHPEY